MVAIIGVCSTEKSTMLLEERQTVVFYVSETASKKEIAEHAKQLLGCDVLGVRTMLDPKGRKKAYVRLAKGIDIDDISAKLKLV